MPPDQLWGFLLPWCEALQTHLHLWAETDEREGWGGHARLLHLDVPAHFDDQDFRQIREALALLGAVAHADEAAFLYLLEHHCNVSRVTAYDAMPLFIEEKIPMRFYLSFGQANPDSDSLVRLCGVEQREQPSDAYQAAMTKIASLHPSIKERRPGLDLKIPVRVTFYPDGTMNGVEEVVKAERDIKKQWAEYELRSGQDDVANGAIRSTLVLQPMDISFAEYEDAIEPELPQVMEQLVRDNVWFSTVALHLDVDENLRRNRSALGKVFGQLFSSVFDSTRRSLELANGRFDRDVSSAESAPPHQLGRLKLGCNAINGSKYELLFSAAAMNQVTPSLELSDPGESGQGILWWKWVAYGVFSRRARACSVLRSLNLSDVCSISFGDMEAFSAVLKSDHPEEELFTSPRGSVPERDVTLRAGAPIRWDTFTLGAEHEISGVRTFSDDGESEWVSALIPGYGRCQVQREDCYPSDSAASEETDGLMSLQIHFTYDTEIADGLPRFLATIGSSLECLVLSDPNEAADVAMILRSCPNLHELYLCGRLIELQLNLDGYVFDPDSNLLGTKWNQVAEISRCLSDSSNELVKRVRQLRVQLALQPGMRGYVSGSLQGKLNALLRMLEANPHLERVQVIVPLQYENYAEAFNKHHLTPIAQALPLDLSVKLAFLSGTVSRKEPSTAAGNKKRTRTLSDRLDVLVLTKVFGYAAPCVLRQVAFRAVRPMR